MTHLFKKIMMLTLGVAMAGGMTFLSTEAKPVIESEAKSSTILRIWLHRSIWQDSSAIVKLKYWITGYEASSTTIPPGGYVENSLMSVWYAYYDVPDNFTSGYNYQFLRYDSTGTSLWNTSTSYVFTSGMNNLMWYLYDVDYMDSDAVPATISQGVVDSTSAYFVSKVLEGYMSCYYGLENGYEAYPSILSTYIKNGDLWRMTGILSEQLITDYATEADYAIGKGTGVSVNAYDKLEMMRLQYEAAHQAPGALNLGTMLDENSILGISLVSIIGMTTIGCFYLLARKKEQA